MAKKKPISVVYYDCERVPDDRPGAGDVSLDLFFDVREGIVDICRGHGTVGPDDSGDCDYYVIDDQYNVERYQYLEVNNPSAMTKEWLLDLMDGLSKCPHWGIGVQCIGEGYLLIFHDRLMVNGPTFEGAVTLEEVVDRARLALELAKMANACKTDDDLARLRQVPGIEKISMNLWGLSEVTDEGLVHMEGLTGVVSLRLGDAVTDRGLIHLRGLANLTDLTLGPQITDDGLSHVRCLAQLEELDLHGSKVAGAGFHHLGNLSRLSDLNVASTPVEDTGLAQLQCLAKSLTKLDLTETLITDEGLKHLLQFPKLCNVYLALTRVSDKGLKHLEQLAALNRLDVRNTQVTEKAAKRFQSRFPNCDLQGP